MSRPRIDMRAIRQILRLALGEGLSRNRVALATGVPRTTVKDCLVRAQAAGIGWPIPDELDDAALEARLYRRPGEVASGTRPLPDWAHVHHELHRKGVTLQLLWIEYKELHPDGYQYTQFVQRYRAWALHLKAVMRQTHRAGEKLFVDFAGPTLPITDRVTGEVWQAQLYVAAMGASSYTFLDVLASQGEVDWLEATSRCFTDLNGVPEMVVPDNLKAAVTAAHRYEPVLNRAFGEFAEHFGTAIVPARPYRPRDKAKAEVAVLVAERWVLARLRHRVFFSLAEARAAVALLQHDLNDRPMQRRGRSRRELFVELDRPALRPLPAAPYLYASWSRPKVHIDYHVEVDRHYYSVPYTLIGLQLDARLTARTVEISHRGRRVASHKRSFVRGEYTTLAEHMPRGHREQAEWTPARVLSWTRQTGPNTCLFMERVMERRQHREQGFKTCLWLKRLGDKYGTDRVEAAAARALSIGAYTGRSVDSILKSGLDRQPLLTVVAGDEATPMHENVRGSGYYRREDEARAATATSDDADHGDDDNPDGDTAGMEEGARC